MSHLLDNLLIFGRVLRRRRRRRPPGRLLDVVDALGHVDLGARDEVYHTCRALLVHRHEQIAIFDRAFDAFWREHHDSEIPRTPGDATPRPPRRSKSRRWLRFMVPTRLPGSTTRKTSRRRKAA